MRPFEGKEFALWLDHSGNYLRFRDDWDEIYVDGVKSLEGKSEKAKKEPTEKVKKESKCPSCGYLWPSHTDTCPSCGHIRQKRNLVDHVSGQLVEFVAEKKAVKENKQAFYSEMLYIADQKNYNPNWASHKYREKFGVWPRGLDDTKMPPSINTMKWVTHKQIAWAKRKEKEHVES
jgi:hypothetical protein